MKLLPLILTLTWTSVMAHAAALETRVQSVEEIQALQDRAIDLYGKKLYPEAEKTFYDLLAADYQGPTGTYAVTYLKRILNESGAVSNALKEYEALEAKGKVMDSPAWAGGLDRNFFTNLTQPGKLESYIFSVFKLGGMIAARFSLLGVVLDQAGYKGPAAFYVEKATSFIDVIQKEAYVERRENLKLRPLQYVWPTIYDEQVGLPLFRPAQVEIVNFSDPAALYEDLDIRKSLSGMKPHINAGYFTQFDSNVRNMEDSAAVAASGIQKNEGSLHHAFLNIGAQGNIQGTRSYGWDYILHMRRYSRHDLREYNTLSHLPSVFLSFSNRRDSEFRFRYDFAFTLHRQVYVDAFNRSHGPQIAWTQLVNNRTLVTADYSFKFNVDDAANTVPTLSRNSNQHTFRLRVAYPGQNNRTQPYVRYMLDRNHARKTAYDYFSHRLDAGAVRLIGRAASVDLGTGFERRNYRGPAARGEDVFRARLDAAIPLGGDLLTVMSGASLDVHSSDLAAYKYNEYLLTGGVTVHFGF